jgi:hypothetical protein
MYRGHLERGRQLLEAALAINKATGHQLHLSFNLSNLGLATLREGRLNEAEHLFTRSLRIKHELGNSSGIPLSLDGLAEAPAERGQWTRAAQLSAASSAIREADGIALYPPSERLRRQQMLATARTVRGDEAFAAACSEGQAWTGEQMMAHVTREQTRAERDN